MNENAANPFTLSFGEKPYQYVERSLATDELIRDITSVHPTHRTFIVSGIRGSGKTVFLTDVMNKMEALDGWIIVELNPEDEMREALAAKLYSHAKLKHLFLEKEFSFSFQGISFSIKGKNPVPNIDDLLSRMFAALKRSGKKVLICVDEVSSSPAMRRFALSFQILIRQGYELFFLGTGLYENVSELENRKNLTFLIRASKTELSSLSLASIASSYMKSLGVNKTKGEELARATKGYAFAFQLLGYLLFRNKETSLTEEILHEYDENLSSYAYEKIWSTCSENDKKLVLAFPSNESAETKEILAGSKLSKDSFSTYRSRLLNKGIIVSLGWGKLMLALPRFREFMDGKMIMDF